jgi:hypothetical protein
MIKSFIHYNDLNLKLFFRRTQINPSCATHNQFIHFIILYFLSILNFFLYSFEKKAFIILQNVFAVFSQRQECKLSPY